MCQITSSFPQLAQKFFKVFFFVNIESLRAIFTPFWSQTSQTRCQTGLRSSSPSSSPIKCYLIILTKPKHTAKMGAPKIFGISTVAPINLPLLNTGGGAVQIIGFILGEKRRESEGKSKKRDGQYIVEQLDNHLTKKFNKKEVIITSPWKNTAKFPNPSPVRTPVTSSPPPSHLDKTWKRNIFCIWT